MNKYLYVSLGVILFLVNAGCAEEQVYEAIRIKQKNDCLSLPPAQYEECMARYEKNYDQYKEEREEIKQ